MSKKDKGMVAEDQNEIVPQDQDVVDETDAVVESDAEVLDKRKAYAKEYNKRKAAQRAIFRKYKDDLIATGKLSPEEVEVLNAMTAETPAAHGGIFNNLFEGTNSVTVAEALRKTLKGPAELKKYFKSFNKESTGPFVKYEVNPNDVLQSVFTLVDNADEALM